MLALSSAVLSRGLRSMLESIPEVRSVSDCFSAADLGRPGQHDDDVIVICSPQLFEELYSCYESGPAPAAKFLVLMPNASEETIALVSALSADGYVLEPGLTPHLLHHAMRQLLDGETPVPGALVRGLLTTQRVGRARNPRSFAITPREVQVLALLVEGLSNKEIAARLGVSVNAAKRHVANVLAKLNCRNRTHAVALVIREDILRGHGQALATPSREGGLGGGL